MGQFNWTVLGQQGRQYRVGIYHGEKSGHLMVHCNSKVVLVDFFVKDTKDYSFFIDDEFFVLEVEKKDGQFLYGLELDTTTDTPLNQLRKKRDIKHLVMVGLIIAGIIAVAIGFFWGYPKYQSLKSEAEKTEILAQNGIETTAEIRYDSTSTEMKYFFVGDGKAISGSPVFENENKPVFPLKHGEVFLVKYSKNTPELHQVYWTQLPDEQLTNYKNRTGVIHKEANPTFSDLKVNCQVELAFRIDDFDGLKQLFYQNETLESNPDFNTISYQKFIRDEPFRNLSKENCWP